MHTNMPPTSSKRSNIINRCNYILSTVGICLLLLTSKTFAKPQSCFNSVSIEPGFIAFTATKDSQLGEWYKSTFDLQTVKEFAFPDGSVTGVLMRRKEFVVEVFYRDDALERKTYVPESKTEQWTGVMKFGLYTDADLPQLKECLIAQGVQATRIWKDKKLGIDLLQVIDPNQNVIEIIRRKVY